MDLQGKYRALFESQPFKRSNRRSTFLRSCNFKKEIYTVGYNATSSSVGLNILGRLPITLNKGDNFL